MIFFDIINVCKGEWTLACLMKRNGKGVQQNKVKRKWSTFSFSISNFFDNWAKRKRKGDKKQK